MSIFWNSFLESLFKLTKNPEDKNPAETISQQYIEKIPKISVEEKIKNKLSTLQPVIMESLNETVLHLSNETKSSKNRNNLEKHAKEVHEGKKPKKCDLCHQTFTRNWSLKKHIVQNFTLQGYIVMAKSVLL